MKPVSEAALARFWANVQLPIDGEGCLEWTGLNVQGYGRMRCDGARVAAHRLSYEMSVGEIPEGLQIDHLCRNPSCVRPDHLEPVTHAENQRRKVLAITHCRRGHEYNEANTYRKPNGKRSCRQCHREDERVRYRARKDA